MRRIINAFYSMTDVDYVGRTHAMTKYWVHTCQEKPGIVMEFEREIFQGQES